MPPHFREKPGHCIRPSEISNRSANLPREGSEIPLRTVLRLIFHERTKLFNLQLRPSSGFATSVPSTDAPRVRPGRFRNG